MARLRRRGPAGAGASDLPGKAGDAETLRWCRDVVARAGALEPETRDLDDEGLRALTGSFRERLSRGEPVDRLLPEAFAAVREAAARALGQRPFDVQVMGGAVLHLGKIAEMRTGEGKTLTATLPAYLNALAGSGVHVMTANSYLASRDAEWMGPVYRFLGLEAGLLREVQHGLAEHRAAYRADITYGNWQEFGYDYLRDNLAWSRDEIAQRGRHFAIVDEADLILIDEMRTPLLISAPADQPESRHAEFAALAARLQRGDHYEADERARTVSLTESGQQAVQEHFGVGNLYDEPNLAVAHYVQSALRAKEHFRQGRDYVVTGGEAVVIDQASGRPQRGRRYSDGIHEAVEAKEGLSIGAEQQTLATMPVWDYLGEYERLAGMTGTAAAEAETYRQIYRLDVVTIPTNKPMIRVDHRDAVYRTRRSKLAALAGETAARHATGQPVLIGATSAEEAQDISGLLADRGIAHEVLTALNHEQEAPAIAGAARIGAVTVVAKMAGRGVDIILGGPDGARHDAVADLGGLCVLGAERAARQRLELHLRGRAGRQGDPGEAKFFVSFEDELIKAAVGAKQAAFWSRHSPEGDQIARVSATLTSAQARTTVSETAYLVRAREYDQVLAAQRRLMYAERAPALRGEDLGDRVRKLIDEVTRAQAGEAAAEDAQRRYRRREAELGTDVIRELERRVVLACLNRGWREHLQAMPELLNGIAIRMAGDAALTEYRREGTLAFNRMREAVNKEIVDALFRIRPSRSDLGLPD